MPVLDPDDAFWEDSYRRLGSWPSLWQDRARDLICAANVLHRRKRRLGWIKRSRGSRTAIHPGRYHTNSTIFMMLYAMALENLVKAILVAKGTHATATGRLDRSLWGHKLNDLFGRAGLPTSADDRWFLDQLQTFIESGKYPFGTHPPRGVTKQKHGLIVPKDIDHVFRLIELAELTLCRLAPDDTLRTINLRALCAKA